MHVTGACTRHAPWIQPARDSDSSAREAALRKRRERDRDNRDSSEREARLSRRRQIKGNGTVYKDLNLARASRRAINRHVTC